MRAAEIMTARVVAVDATTNIIAIARLLRRHRIGAVPVTDRAGRVIGIVGRRDLRQASARTRPLTAGPSAERRWLTRPATAADVMSAPVVCVDADDDIRQVAWLMADRGLGRVPVVRAGRLIGIVARSDLLRAMAVAADRLRSGARRAEWPLVLPATPDWLPASAAARLN